MIPAFTVGLAGWQGQSGCVKSCRTAITVSALTTVVGGGGGVVVQVVVVLSYCIAVSGLTTVVEELFKLWVVLSYCIAVSGLTTVVEELFRLWWYCHIVLLYLV